MSRLLFTGERLHAEDELFAIDIVRHRAALAHAIRLDQQEASEAILELGCGTGYGTAELAEALPRVIAVDRIAPDPESRHQSACFIRADARAIPLHPGHFDMVVSFQVIEHIENPKPFLESIARMLKPAGCALLSTPNLKQSDGENPFHVREYSAEDLSELLAPHFEEVVMLGVSARAEPKAYYDARLRRIRSIVRLDPLGLRRRLPRRLIDPLFAALAVIVRRGLKNREEFPNVDLDDFPIVPARDDCLDLLALCRRPRLEAEGETETASRT